MYKQKYDAYKNRVENALLHAVPEDIPSPLKDAMRYSLLAGGKRLRPVLLLSACQLMEEKKDFTDVMPFACAIEMIHTYSLIHDDLPAMDNDDMRRGKKTCHIMYGEDMAILAGDALQSLAIETMLQSDHPFSLSAMREIMTGAGVTGMLAGQTVDVISENKEIDDKTLLYIHQNKTAKLITAPVVAGLILSGADEKQVEMGRVFGQELGLAFQIIDDLLDVRGDQALMGKTLHKDEKEGKATWVSMFSEEKAVQDAKKHTENAIQALFSFSDEKNFLKTLANSMLERVQ